MAKGPRDHYLPAAVIGLFGRHSGAKLREAVVAVRRRGEATARLASAESIGWVRDLYTLKNPPVPLDARAIDDIWRKIESDVVKSIRALEAGSITNDDIGWLTAYIAALGVRHPTYFNRVVRREWAKHEREPPLGDVLQLVRIQGFQNALRQVANLRWRTVASPEDFARPFILNDRGFSQVSEQGRDGNALFVPLAPRIAILAYQDTRMRFLDRRVATSLTVDWLNAATWTDAESFALSHPDEQAVLENLASVDAVRTPPNGPYRLKTHTLLGD